jgi:hypothetical protein
LCPATRRGPDPVIFVSLIGRRSWLHGPWPSRWLATCLTVAAVSTAPGARTRLDGRPRPQPRRPRCRHDQGGRHGGAAGGTRLIRVASVRRAQGFRPRQAGPGSTAAVGERNWSRSCASWSSRAWKTSRQQPPRRCRKGDAEMPGQATAVHRPLEIPRAQVVSRRQVPRNAVHNLVLVGRQAISARMTERRWLTCSASSLPRRADRAPVGKARGPSPGAPPQPAHPVPAQVDQHLPDVGSGASRAVVTAARSSRAVCSRTRRPRSRSQRLQLPPSARTKSSNSRPVFMPIRTPSLGGGLPRPRPGIRPARRATRSAPWCGTALSRWRPAARIVG